MARAPPHRAPVLVIVWAENREDCVGPLWRERDAMGEEGMHLVEHCRQDRIHQRAGLLTP